MVHVKSRMMNADVFIHKRVSLYQGNVMKRHEKYVALMSSCESRDKSRQLHFLFDVFFSFCCLDSWSFQTIWNRNCEIFFVNYHFFGVCEFNPIGIHVRWWSARKPQHWFFFFLHSAVHMCIGWTPQDSSPIIFHSPFAQDRKLIKDYLSWHIFKASNVHPFLWFAMLRKRKEIENPQPVQSPSQLKVDKQLHDAEAFYLRCNSCDRMLWIPILGWRWRFFVA